MSWEEALEVVVARTRNERFRTVCGEDHPDHEVWRRKVVEKATGQAPTPAEYPSLFRQAANLAGAVGRVVAAAAQGEAVLVTAEVLEQRRAICLGCDLNGHRESGGIRCTKCGCLGIRLEFAALACPVGKWEAVTDASR
jgi:hypothetical protein